MDASSKSGPGRARRAIAMVAKVLGLATTFTVAAAGGAILHIDLPAPRRVVVARVNSALDGTFKGRIVINTLGGVGFGGVDDVDVDIFDPEGHRAAAVRRASVRIGLRTLLESLIGKGDIQIDLTQVHAATADVRLELNDAGDFGIARAFDSRETSAPGGRATAVHIERIDLARATIHGVVAKGVPPIAATVDAVRAAVDSDSKGVRIDLPHATVDVHGLEGKDPHGELSGHIDVPDDPKAAMSGGGNFAGQVGAVPITVQANRTPKRVDAVVDVPETDPAALRALQPDVVTVQARTSLHAEAHGDLPNVTASLEAKVGSGTVSATAEGRIPDDHDPTTAAHAVIEFAAVDASQIVASAPKTRLGGKMDVTATVRGAEVEGTYRFDGTPGEAADQVIPAATLTGSFDRHHLRGTGHVSEVGAPTDVVYSLAAKPGASAPTEADLQATTAVDLATFQRVPGIGHGVVRAKVEGHIDLETKAIRASAEGSVSDFSGQGVSLGYALFHGSADGNASSPHFAARVEGAGLSASGYGFKVVSANVEGTPNAIAVSALLDGDQATPSVNARAHVALGSTIRLDTAFVKLTRNGYAATTTVERVTIQGKTIAADGVRIEGLGAPLEGSARMSNGMLAVKARGTDVDIACLAGLFAKDTDKDAKSASGHAALDIDLRTDGRGAHGAARVDLTALHYRDIDGGALRVDAKIDGRRLSGEVVGGLGNAGKVDITTDRIDLAAAPLLPRAWTHATGKIAIDGKVDMARLMAMLPKATLPLDSATGVVTLAGSLDRQREDDLPKLDLHGKTTGLSLLGKQEFVAAPNGKQLGPPPWHVEGIDGSFEVQADVRAGHVQGKVAFVDAKGALADVDAKIDGPFADLLNGKVTTTVAVERAKFDVHAHVPRRDIDALPTAIRSFAPARGFVSLDAEASGDAAHPSIHVKARGEQLIAKDAPKRVKPADVGLDATYDGAHANVHATVDYESRHVLDATATLDARAEDFANSGAKAQWVGSADVKAENFPLEALADLAGQHARGRIDGEAKIGNLHKDAALDADFKLSEVVLDDTALPRSRVIVKVAGGVLGAHVQLEQSDGWADLTAKGGVTWGAALTPTPDAKSGVDVALLARNFRVDGIAPFLRGALNDLDGRIDAKVTAHVDPKLTSGKATGALALRDGSFEVPAIGERFHGVRAKVTMDPWGTLKVDNVEAQAATGKLTAAARATLSGLTLQHAEGAIHIAKGDSFPIAVQGVPMGRASGDIRVLAALSPDQKRIGVTVDIPQLAIDLPQSTGHNVQDDDPDKHVRIGVHRTSEFAELALGPPAKPVNPSGRFIRATVKLGEVEIKRDTTLRVVVTGSPVFEIGDKTRASGKIIVKSGKLEVQGKRFTVDHGIVTFTGKPDQPQIVATAYWDAPDGTRVYADFAGTPKQGKLTMRSDPPRTQDELVALVLFGASDAQFGASTPGSTDESMAAKGVGAAGGVMTQGVNKAISGVTSVDVSTRVDTSEADNPKPEVVVQLTSRVSAEVAYAVGTPPPGENPDRTTLTLDFHITDHWSIDAMVGDAGSSALDLVWRLRY